MYTPNDAKKERFWVSSVNLEKKKHKPVVELPTRYDKKVGTEEPKAAEPAAKFHGDVWEEQHVNTPMERGDVLKFLKEKQRELKLELQ